MDSTASDVELDVWQADGCAVRIDYSRAVMEEVRLAASDGFHRLSHGGVEIGGVLFGVRDPDAVKILAHRAFACEYAFGPSFTLSDNDRRAFEDLLASPDTDSNLSGMQPVGWYHSHTRSEIQLSEKDLQLFQQCFPGELANRAGAVPAPFRRRSRRFLFSRAGWIAASGIYAP